MENMKMACESVNCYLSTEATYENKKLFVNNLGWLLAQTREGILGAELLEGEIVEVHFKCGYSKKINIAMDSYMAIIKDVVNHI